MAPMNTAWAFKGGSRPFEAVVAGLAVAACSAGRQT